MKIFFLSFCVPDRFLGGTFVRAPSFIAAVQEARLLKCHPGGEVEGYDIAATYDEHIGPEWRNRLLTRAECDALNAILEAETKRKCWHPPVVAEVAPGQVECSACSRRLDATTAYYCGLFYCVDCGWEGRAFVACSDVCQKRIEDEVRPAFRRLVHVGNA